MNKLVHSAESWSSQVKFSEDKRIIDELYGRVSGVKEKWMKSFEQSIQLWVNFIYLRLQSIVKQINPKRQEDSKQTFSELIQKEISRFVTQSQRSVLKGLENIQKLCMISDLRPRSHSKQHKSILDKTTPKSTQKTRSSSFNSNRNQKSSLFSSIKTTVQPSYKKTPSQSISNNFTKLNSTVVKQYRQRPKFQPNFGDTTFSALAMESKSNFNNVVSREMTESLQNHLAHKEKKDQSEIIELVSNKLEQKLKNIESELNLKLNVIIQNMSKQKQNRQSTERKDGNQSKGKEKGQVLQNGNKKQVIKRNSLIKRITSNPISQDAQDIESVHLQNAAQRKTKIQKIQLAQKNLQQFISLSKKIKLPITQNLLKIFLNSYVGICHQSSHSPNLQKFGIEKWDYIQNKVQARNEVKQSILKLKKLIGMDGLNGKAEKIKIYLEQCLRCSYSILLRQDYQLQQELGVQIDRIMPKL